MRTNIVIDDTLMREVLKKKKFKTKKEAVEHGLRLILQLNDQEEIKIFRGKLRWTGDLKSMRSTT
jgi:Arc/MetJ family transcription regulator